MISHRNQCLNTNLYIATHFTFPLFSFFPLLPLARHFPPFLLLFPVAASLSYSSLSSEVTSRKTTRKLTSISILTSMHKITFDLTFFFFFSRHLGEEQERSLSLSLSRQFPAENKKMNFQCLSLSSFLLYIYIKCLGVNHPMVITHLPSISLSHLSIPCGL